MSPITDIPTSLLFEETRFDVDCLKAHNIFRSLHNVPPLKLSTSISAVAQEWAQHLIDFGLVDHRPHNKYGENIYATSEENFRGIAPVLSWYKSGETYDYDHPKPIVTSTGRFTQVVWKETTTLGVGIARKEGITIVVANYYPAGNFVGRFKQNVTRAPDAVPTIKLLEKQLENNFDLRKQSNSSARVSSHKKKSTVKNKGKRMYAGIQHFQLGEPISEIAHLSNHEQTFNVFGFQSTFLWAHNKYRALHDAPPLKLSPALSSYAFEWAKSMAIDGIWRENSVYGKNIYIATSSEALTGASPVKKWYKQFVNYDFKTMSHSPNASHFTQLIWKSTREIGFGYYTIDGKTYIVANYKPKGNIEGQYAINVLPLKKYPVQGGVDLFSSNRMGSKSRLAFQMECLEAHNVFRIKHGVPLLEISQKLCNYAQQRAEHLSETRIWENRPNAPYGESIYVSIGKEVTASYIVRKWYEEKTGFNFRDPKFRRKTAYFSQIVWRSTAFLGVGIVKTNDEVYVLVAYSPKGNVKDQFKDNVFPAIKEHSDHWLKLRTVMKAAHALQVKVKHPLDSCLKKSTREDQQFRQEFLSTHNMCRVLHNVPLLNYNSKLTAFAQERAKELAESPSHFKKNKYFGENIYIATRKIVNGTAPAFKWYEEMSQYDFKNPEQNEGATHFTQIVWKSSRELGVGIVRTQEKMYVVANYFPKGNIKSHFADNVLPPVLIANMRQSSPAALEDRGHGLKYNLPTKKISFYTDSNLKTRDIPIPPTSGTETPPLVLSSSVILSHAIKPKQLHSADFEHVFLSNSATPTMAPSNLGKSHTSVLPQL